MSTVRQQPCAGARFLVDLGDGSDPWAPGAGFCQVVLPRLEVGIPVDGPLLPGSPVAPAGTIAPVSPGLPVSPISPVSPVSPVSPIAPPGPPLPVTVPEAQRLVLRRGATGALDLYGWWLLAWQGRAPQGRVVQVTLLAEDNHTAVMTWRFRNARPLALAYTPLDANSDALLIETIELAFDHYEIA